jgi:hypothetical protein
VVVTLDYGLNSGLKVIYEEVKFYDFDGCSRDEKRLNNHVEITWNMLNFYRLMLPNFAENDVELHRRGSYVVWAGFFRPYKSLCSCLGLSSHSDDDVPHWVHVRTDLGRLYRSVMKIGSHTRP